MSEGPVLLKKEDALFLASRGSPIYVETATEMADRAALHRALSLCLALF